MKYRVAAAACPAQINDWQTNLAVMEEWTRQAVQRHCRLVLFPELGVTGYSTTRQLECCHDEHPATQRLAELSVQYQIAIAAGMAWRNKDGHTYLAHGIWTPAGERHLYYKTHLGGREETVFRAGNTLPVFQLPAIQVGMHLCLEHHFPDIAQTLVLRGAQLILCPHATPRITPAHRRDSWHIALRARAYDNCTYILATNQQGENGQGLSYPGGLLAVDPSGRVLAEDFSGQPGLIVADLDLKQTENSRTTPQGMCRRFYAPSRRKELYE